jgi:hypothetical protein
MPKLCSVKAGHSGTDARAHRGRPTRGRPAGTRGTQDTRPRAAGRGELCPPLARQHQPGHQGAQGDEDEPGDLHVLPRPPHHSPDPHAARRSHGHPHAVGQAGRRVPQRLGGVATRRAGAGGRGRRYDDMPPVATECLPTDLADVAPILPTMHPDVPVPSKVVGRAGDVGAGLRLWVHGLAQADEIGEWRSRR